MARRLQFKIEDTVIQLKNSNRYQIITPDKTIDGSFKQAIKILLTALYFNKIILDYQEQPFLDNSSRLGIIDTIRHFDL